MARVNGVSFREDLSVESVCRRVVAAGFDSLEVSRPPFYEKLITPETRQRFVEWTTEIGLSLYGFDCWVDVDPYNDVEQTMADFDTAIDWAAELDLGMVISHDPWAKDNGDRSPSACLEANVALFQRVADLCAAKKLRLVFEPHPDTLSIENAWAIDFIDRLAAGRPAHAVGLLYDSCHYGVGQPDSYVDSIVALGSRIEHFHFSDGDRRTYALHLPLGDGELDLEAVVSALSDIGYAGTFTNDLYSYPMVDDGARRNAPKIRELEQRLHIGEPGGLA